MATIRKIINSAYRQLGIIGGEGQKPSNWEYADAISALQSAIRGLVNSGALGRMRDVVPIGSYCAGENERVFRVHDDPLQIITLPDLIGSHENYTLDYGRAVPDTANLRPVKDGAFVSIVDSVSGGIQDFIFDGQTKRWISIANLKIEYDETDNSKAMLETTLDSSCPFAFANPLGLSSYLALQLAGEFGSKIPEVTALNSRNFLIAITHSYSTRDYSRRS